MTLKQLKELRKWLRNGFASGQLYTACSILMMVIVGYYVSYVYSSEPITKTDFVLNTVATVTIYDSQDTNLLEEVFALCRSYEIIFSATNPNSELYKLNEQMIVQHNIPIPISNELGTLIQSALTYAEQSNGAFDPTIGTVTNLWDFTGDTPVPPNTTIISNLLPLVDYQSLTVEDHTITNSILGTQLDLGGIAKGYIADTLKVFLQENNVNSAYINLGGNIVCIGTKPQNQSFQVGIQKPFEEYSELIAHMSIENASVVTCGIYERAFSYEGTLYHHILNPSTGFPYENELASVTIVSPHSIDGDALSTTCYTLGTIKGIELLESISNTHGIFIDLDGNITYTKGFERLFAVTKVE